MADSEDDDYPFDWRSADLVMWLKQQPGATVSSKIQLTDLRSRGAGRGVGKISFLSRFILTILSCRLILLVVAITDIAVDEELFTISLIDVLTVKTSSLAKTHLGPAIQQLDEWLALALTLLFEFGQRERSHWKAYLDILPRSFDTLMYCMEFPPLSPLCAKPCGVPVAFDDSRIFSRMTYSGYQKGDAIILTPSSPQGRRQN